MHAIAAKAICFKEAMSDDFKAYQQQVVKMLKRWLKYSSLVVMMLFLAVQTTTYSCYL